MKVNDSDALSHPWSKRVNLEEAKVSAPEFIIDNVIASGTVAIAGTRGVGKTSCLIPLVLHATNLVQNSELTATITRKVFYVTEDTEQAQQIIAGLLKTGDLACTRKQLSEMFHLIPATRISPNQVIEFATELNAAKYPNRRSDRTYYEAPPVIVLDTVNATMSIENINDNAAVSAALATIQNGLRGFPVILVGHVPKHAKNKPWVGSFLGAGSWENDVRQTLILDKEKDGKRYLTLDKIRFNPRVMQYELSPRRITLDTTNSLGQSEHITCTYSLPIPVSEAEIKRRAKEAKIRRNDALETSIVELIGERPGIGANDIKARIQGGAQPITYAIKSLLKSDRIRMETKGRAHYYYVTHTSQSN